MFPLSLISLLVVASTVTATPWIRDTNLIAPRAHDADCGTSTTTVTSTLTPSGQPRVSAEVVSVTSIISSFTTISAPNIQLTCFSSATTLTPAAATPKNRKRDGQGYKVYELVEDIDCSCDKESEHKSTSFFTSYFAAPTPPASPAESCSSTTTTTTVTTALSSAAVAVTTTTITTTIISTQTAVPVAIALAPTVQGLNYYFYPDQTYPTPQIDFVNVTELPPLINGLSNNPKFAHSGTIANINALKISSPNDADPKIYYSEDQTITMPDGYQAHGNMFGIVFQGYLFAASGAGSYTIQSVNPVLDDVGLVWLGAKALGNNWNYGNPNYQIILQQPTQQTSVQLAAGEAMPMTIFYANVDGPGRASFNVVTPDGTVHNDTTGFFVGGCGNTGFMP